MWAPPGELQVRWHPPGEAHSSACAKTRLFPVEPRPEMALEGGGDPSQLARLFHRKTAEHSIPLVEAVNLLAPGDGFEEALQETATVAMVRELAAAIKRIGSVSVEPG